MIQINRMCVMSLLALVWLAGLCVTARADDNSDLLAAARKGEGVETLLNKGASINFQDASGKTALHYAAEGGHMMTTELLLKKGADPNLTDAAGRTPLEYAEQKGHSGTADMLRPLTKRVEAKPAGGGQTAASLNAKDSSGKTALHRAAEGGDMHEVISLIKQGADANLIDTAGRTALDYAEQKGHSGTAEALRAVTREQGPQRVNPSLEYPDLASFQKSIGMPACLLKSEHVWVFAPKRSEDAAKIVLPYLVNAYDWLRRLTGVDTQYIIVVYNFPRGFPGVRGGTSGCVIRYNDDNLQLDQSEEWRSHRIPHVSGYIEEMAHNFVSTTNARFGWEMVGWTIGAMASAAVADNPIFRRGVLATRQGQAETFQRYCRLGNTFPPDLEANQVDRIHAYLLWQCEQRYGPKFWPDFFKEIALQKKALAEATFLGEDGVENERYRLTVECFDRLPGIKFKQMLLDAGISPTVDVTSLHPTNPGWNRKLQ